MLAPDSPVFFCLISWFRPCLPPTTLPHGSPGNNISLLSPTTIFVCPFLDSACLLPWLSGDYPIQLYRVSVPPVSSVASCSSGTRIIPSLETFKSQRPEDRLFCLLPLFPGRVLNKVCYQLYLPVFVLLLCPNQTRCTGDCGTGNCGTGDCDAAGRPVKHTHSVCMNPRCQKSCRMRHCPAETTTERTSP